MNFFEQWQGDDDRTRKHLEWMRDRQRIKDISDTPSQEKLFHGFKVLAHQDYMLVDEQSEEVKFYLLITYGITEGYMLLTEASE